MNILMKTAAQSCVAIAAMLASTGASEAASIVAYDFTATGTGTGGDTLAGRFSYVAGQGPSMVQTSQPSAEFAATDGWRFDIAYGGQHVAIVPGDFHFEAWVTHDFEGIDTFGVMILHPDDLTHSR